MTQAFNVSTEGVLVLCTQAGLKGYYQDKTFDYDYPEGILPLINQGIALAITTESGDVVCLKVTFDTPSDVSSFQDLGTYQIQVQAENTLLFLDHATFTQICDWHKGDISKYEFDETYNPKVTLEDVPAGWYQVTVYGQTLDEFEEKECYIEMILIFTPINHQTNLKIKDIAAI
ncbi:hypothetical protein BKI52_23990 [marine bacterium AO1-C]|nr:hypothetical protein BKI52_23990 [marine bacterium AO1-C]